jgi:hypothetical protein
MTCGPFCFTKGLQGKMNPTTNYICKTSSYTTFRMHPSGPWPLKILMFALLLTCEIATKNWPREKTGDSEYTLGLLLILKSWGCPPPLPPAGHAFPRQRHMPYLFLPGFPSLYDAIQGWMTRWMDGWMESFTKNDNDTYFQRLETDHLNCGYPSYTLIRKGEIHEPDFQYLFYQFSSQFFFHLNFNLIFKLDGIYLNSNSIQIYFNLIQ